MSPKGSPVFTAPILLEYHTIRTQKCKKLARASFLGWGWGGVTCTVTQGPVFRRAPYMVEFSPVTILNFLILFEQGTSHCYFALDPVNCIQILTHLSSLELMPTCPIPCSDLGKGQVK